MRSKSIALFAIVASLFVGLMVTSAGASVRHSGSCSTAAGYAYRSGNYAVGTGVTSCGGGITVSIWKWSGSQWQDMAVAVGGSSATASWQCQRWGTGPYVPWRVKASAGGKTAERNDSIRCGA